MARPATEQVVERRGKNGTSYGLRFRAYGARHYVTAAATNRPAAKVELQNTLADVRRGIWQPRRPQTSEAPVAMPTFHEFADEWLERMRGRGLSERTIVDYQWALELHLLPNFGTLQLDQIDKRFVDRYSTAKLAEGKLCAATINKTLVRLAQVLGDAED